MIRKCNHERDSAGHALRFCTQNGLIHDLHQRRVHSRGTIECPQSRAIMSPRARQPRARTFEIVGDRLDALRARSRAVSEPIRPRGANEARRLT